MVQMCDKQCYRVIDKKCSQEKYQGILRNIGISFVLIALCIFILICISVPVHAYTDNFDTNSILDYTGYIGSPPSYIDVSLSHLIQRTDLFRLLYNNQIYSNGNFTAKFRVNGSFETIPEPRLYFGSANLYTAADTTWLCNVQSETFYRIGYDISVGKFGIEMCNSGNHSYISVIDGYPFGSDTGYLYYIINWNPSGLPFPFPTGETINLTYYKESDGIPHYLSSSNTIITSGYSGIGSGYWITLYEWDWVKFEESGYIPPPSSNFHAIPTTGDAPLNVSFIDDSTGTPTSWNWSFGDGYISDEQNPYHIYTIPDTYDVNLTACNVGGCDIEEKLWYISVNIPVEPTPPPTEEQIKINLISKGKNFILWQWNKTGVNYTILDGEPKILKNGTYVYSNLLPNTTHILSISWDGINETVSIVKTDSEYDYFKWFFIAMGLIMLLISLKIAVFSVVSSVIFITNLAYNYTLYTKMEITICILLLIVSIILIDFNYGSK